MRKNFMSGPAPSISAASYSSFGMFCRPAKKYRTLTPIHRHEASKTMRNMPVFQCIIHCLGEKPSKARSEERRVGKEERSMKESKHGGGHRRDGDAIVY